MYLLLNIVTKSEPPCITNGIANLYFDLFIFDNKNTI